MGKIENPKSKIQNSLVRPLHSHDAADLYAIFSHPRVVRTLSGTPSGEFPEIEAWAGQPEAGTHRLVVQVGEKVIGIGGLVQIPNPRMAHSGYLRGISVHPDYWGQGFGTALMVALLDLADNWLNLKRIELGVTKQNEVAIHLYEKFGFQGEGTRRHSVFSVGGYQDELTMARFHDLPTMPNRDLPQRSQEIIPETQFDAQSLIIAPVHPDDINGLYELFRHPLVCRTTGQLPSQEITRTQERVNESQPYRHRLVAHLGDKVVGMISMTVMQRPRRAHSASIGMMVHPGYWGYGIGSQLLAAIVDLADNWLNLKRIELDVNTDNAAGIGLYKKFGFQVEGTKRFQIYGDGRWADTHFMARVLEDR